MNTSSDAAEQLVRMSLNTAEVAVKITGNGAKNVAVMIYAVMKDQKQTKGKTRLNNMLKSGQPLKVYSIRDKDLQQFCAEAKKYGVLYCVLKDKNINDGMSDIMVREFDSAKISRIFERFNLAKIDVANVKPEEKNKESILFDDADAYREKRFMRDVMNVERQNSSTARMENRNLSEHSLKPTKESDRVHVNNSIKQQLKEIKEHQKITSKLKTMTMKRGGKNDRQQKC